MSSTIAVLFIVLLVTLVVGIPVGYSVMIACMAFLMVDGSTPLVIVAQKMTDGVGSFTYLAMPLFIFSGNLMVYGSTPRLMRLANMLLHRIPAAWGPPESGPAASSAACPVRAWRPRRRSDPSSARR